MIYSNFPPKLKISRHILYNTDVRLDSMATTPRRSSRLKAKEEDKQAKEATLRSKRRRRTQERKVFGSDSSSLDSSCSEGELGSEGGGEENELELSLVTTPSRTLNKTNNFTKVWVLDVTGVIY